MNMGKEKQRILIVDDTPENLHILTAILRGHYTVMVANDGERALKLAGMDPAPELILLDIMMPGMDGYTVCQTLKNNPVLKDIPIIFISAMSDLSNIVKGFEVGGVDYITKPFHPQEVLVRVHTHMNLQNARSELQSLLSKTLTGSIKVMIELLSFSNPYLVEKSNRIRRFARDMFIALPINSLDAWNIDLAIMLSQIGCISLPDIMKKKNSVTPLTDEELVRFGQYPALGADIVSKIPRLEHVADIIRNQLIHPSLLKKDLPEIVYYGSALLNFMLVYDDLVTSGMASMFAISKLKEQVPNYPVFLINRLSELINKETKNHKHTVRINDLIPGMVLNENIISKSGEILLTKGTELTENLIQVLQRFLKISQSAQAYVKIMEKGTG
jgi:CheY-like chemotaxis protein